MDKPGMGPHDRDTVAGKTDKHLLTSPMLLAHDHVELAFVLPVAILTVMVMSW